jgi:N-acetyl-anhydromuramyl-L-alanine amidase AmpD
MVNRMLSLHDAGADVGNWQRFLSDLGYLDSSGNALMVDEGFGDKTLWATKNFQAASGLQVSGEVDAETFALATTMGLIPFIQAANFTKLWPQKRAVPTLIIVHTMEAPETPHTALNVASWFAGMNAPRASAHYCLDDAATIQCVRESDVAWAAPGANNNGIHLEHAGYAKFGAADWANDYSKAMLERSAQLAAQIMKRYPIPAVHLTVDQLKAGERGFCGHIDVTNAFCGGKGHTDPGGSYPWDSYLARVLELAEKLP